LTQGSVTLLLVWRFYVGTVVTGAGRGKLERLDGEGEVLVVGVVDEEPVIDVLLKTLSLVAGGDERTRLSCTGALLNSSGLGKSLVVCLDTIHYHSPLPISIDRPERHDIGSDRRTQVSLLHQLLQSVHTILSVSQDILVYGLDTFVVILESVLYLIGWILRVLQAPSLDVMERACRGLVIVMVGSMVRCIMDCMDCMDCMMDWYGMMNRCSMVNRNCMVDCSSMVNRNWMVDSSSMVNSYRSMVNTNRIVGHSNRVNSYWIMDYSSRVNSNRTVDYSSSVNRANNLLNY